MRIGLLEFHESPSDSPQHFITGVKARRLVEELCVATHISPHVVKLIVAKSWSVVKSWLALGREQHERGLRAVDARQEEIAQRNARISDPNGAQHGFSRWPSPDLRTCQ